MPQSIPKFDGQELFTNWDGSCGVEVEVAGVSPILQEQHFDRWDGSLVIHHGYGNRQWTAQGILVKETQNALNQTLGTLEGYEDDNFNPDTWRPLVDSSGNSWCCSKIDSVNATGIHYTNDGKWLCFLIVTGHLDGSPVKGS